MSSSGSSASAAAAAASSTMSQATIVLISFAGVAVLIQLVMVIAICVIWCRGGFRKVTTSTLTNGPEPVAVDVVHVPRRLTLFYRRLLRRRGGQSDASPAATEAGNGRAGNASADGPSSTVDVNGNDVTSTYAEPPPPYDVALEMPRTSAGHVVLFYAGSDVDGGGSESRVVFRFTMTDDPGALPPSFAEVVITDETLPTT